MAAVSSTLLSYGRGSRGLRDAGPYWCFLPAALDVLLDVGAAEAADVVFLCCLRAGAAGSAGVGGGQLSSALAEEEAGWDAPAQAKEAEEQAGWDAPAQAQAKEAEEQAKEAEAKEQAG